MLCRKNAHREHAARRGARGGDGNPLLVLVLGGPMGPLEETRASSQKEKEKRERFVGTLGPHASLSHVFAMTKEEKVVAWRVDAVRLQENRKESGGGKSTRGRFLLDVMRGSRRKIISLESTSRLLVLKKKRR